MNPNHDKEGKFASNPGGGAARGRLVRDAAGQLRVEEATFGAGEAGVESAKDVGNGKIATPFEHSPPKTRDEIEAKIGKMLGKDAYEPYEASELGTPMDVPLDGLVTSQDSVYRSSVLSIMRDEEYDYDSGDANSDDVLIVNYKGRNHLLDGNHRATAAWFGGKKTIRASFLKIS